MTKSVCIGLDVHEFKLMISYTRNATVVKYMGSETYRRMKFYHSLENPVNS